MLQRFIQKEKKGVSSLPPLTHAFLTPMAREAVTWQVINDHHITRTFVFLDFIDAMRFVNKVADLAEMEEHHPDISISYNIVRIDIWTHLIDGLSERDFNLASRIDKILRLHV